MRPTRASQIRVGRIGHFDGEVVAAIAEDRLHRHLVEVVFWIVFDLPAIAVEGLVEIAFAVEQADPDQGYAEIAGGFEMVAGEDAQASRVDAQIVGKAKFGREVSDL